MLQGLSLDERFARAVDRAGGAARGWRAHVPAPLAQSIAIAARLDGRAPEELHAYYGDRMPQLLCEMLRDPLVWRPLDGEKLPKLREALDGLQRALASVGLDGAAFSTARAQLARGASVAELYAPALFASGLPLVGAWPHDRARLAAEFSRDGEAAIDRRLSGNLVHELCHGPVRALRGRPAPWMIVEAAALLLGGRARAAHIFPDEPGEAVPGVARFVLVGEALAARFGAGALWRLLDGATLDEALPVRVARALEVAGWQDWLRRRQAPFARDAEEAHAWIKLAEAARAENFFAAQILDGEPDAPLLAARAPDLLGAAASLKWPELAWWHEAPAPEDAARVASGVRALFQVNRMAPNFQTDPAELADGRITVEVEACRIAAARRPDGVFGEPADWLFPPPLARRLHERGARRILVEDATRARRDALAAALTELCLGTQPLAAEVELRAP